MPAMSPREGSEAFPAMIRPGFLARLGSEFSTRERFAPWSQRPKGLVPSSNWKGSSGDSPN